MSPPRRYDSDGAVLPEPVYHALRDHDDRLDALEAKIDIVGADMRRAVDDVRADVHDAVHELKQSNSGETRKAIVAVAIAAITTIGGVFGAARLNSPAPSPPSRSEAVLAARLAACRAMPQGQERAECYERVWLGEPPGAP